MMVYSVTEMKEQTKLLLLGQTTQADDLK